VGAVEVEFVVDGAASDEILRQEQHGGLGVISAVIMCIRTLISAHIL
jgi:hypothetical protein